MNDSVGSMEILVENLRGKYPELYTHIFNVSADYDGSRTYYYTSLATFISIHKLNSQAKIGLWEYQLVWDYICENEDKHDWWML